MGRDHYTWNDQEGTWFRNNVIKYHSKKAWSPESNYPHIMRGFTYHWYLQELHDVGLFPFDYDSGSG